MCVAQAYYDASAMSGAVILKQYMCTVMQKYLVFTHSSVPLFLSATIFNKNKLDLDSSSLNNIIKCFAKRNQTRESQKEISAQRK